MPPRSVKMKRRILGFQRRVWWPKWTPASSSSRIETTDTRSAPFRLVDVVRRRAGRNRAHSDGTPATAGRRVGGTKDRGSLAVARSRESILELGRERRLDVEKFPGERMVEPQCIGMQELPAEPEIAPHAVRRVSRDRQVDGREMDSDLVRSARFEPDVEERALRHQLAHLEQRHGSTRLVGVE